MDGVILTPLKQIIHPKGDVYHAIKVSDFGYDGFGEAYFSSINQNVIKGWKKHSSMTLNLVVPVGAIEFVLYNESKGEFFNIKISKLNYQRLTIKPHLWVAFRGLESENMLLNIANIEHDPKESLNIDIDAIEYNWSLNEASRV